MQTLEYIQKTREYLDYLENHIMNVQKAWGEIQERCKDMPIVCEQFYRQWLDKEISAHDLSKLSEEEFIQYRKHFYPTEYETNFDFTQAWEHHKRNNLHHWETWTTSRLFRRDEWMVHCTHMIIDWMAMGYKFGDTAQQYYEANKDKIELPEKAVSYIYEIFERLEKN